MSRIKAVVVNFNAAQHVLRLVEHLDGSSVIVRVVDNASAPEDMKLIADLAEAHDWVTVDRSDVNLGFGAGVNRGASGLSLTADDLLWVLNPDLIPFPGASQRLAATLDASRADIVSPLIVHGDLAAPTISFAGGNIDWRRGAAIHRLKGAPLAAAGSGLWATDFVTGAAPMLTGAAWQNLGGFREDYFLYWEDADLSMRALRLGYRSVVDREAIVWHKTTGSSDGGRSRTYYRYITRNRERFLQEWTPCELTLRDRMARELETARWLSRALRESDDRLGKARSVIAGRCSS